MAKKIIHKKFRTISDLAMAMAGYAANMLIAAEQLGIKTRTLEVFPLDASDREIVAVLPSVDSKLRTRLGQKRLSFTVAETAVLLLAIAESLIDADEKNCPSLMLAAKKLSESLGSTILSHSMAIKVPKLNAQLFQFKVALIDIRPAIWRRILVPDCTLDEFHLLIQMAFGWENCHLHQFEIGKKRFSTPMPDGYQDEMQFEDETMVALSELLPKSKSKKKVRWLYEYDFGDGWRHEVLFEGLKPSEPKVKYPVCLEGERACPPEDCGGPWGYADYVAAITDPKHEQHEEILEWRGPFDPEAFDAKKATKEMRKGLSDWRNMR